MVSENGMEYDDVEECETDSDIELEDICPLRDDAKIIFEGHNGGILCIDVDEKRNCAFTGGLDDKVITWQLDTGRLICELTAHGDSVTHMSINNDGSLLASGDISGCVIIWKRNNTEGQWIKLHEIETATVVGISWSYTRDQELLFICDTVGTVQSWSTDALNKGPSMYKYGKGCSCSKFCMILNDVWSAVLYGESCGEHENCSNASSLHLIHNSSERCVKVDLSSTDCIEDEDTDEGLGAAWASKAVGQAHIIAIGDWGQIILVNISSQGYTVNHHMTKVPVKDSNLVDNIGFSNQLPYMAFSTKLGLIGVYDLTKQCIRCTWNYGATMPNELRSPDGEIQQGGVSQLCWSPNKPVFYSAGLDGRLCEWDGRTEPVCEVPTWWGYSGIIWDMCVTSDGESIITVSEDKTARVFAL